MLIKVINDQRPVKNGQFVAFTTGKKSINTYPRYLRIGKVISEEKLIIQELESGKEWKVYPSNIITVGDEGILKSVKPVLEYVDYIKP